MTAKFQLRYFFDWKCDPLWSANDAAREAFGYAVEPAELPLSDQTVTRIRKICAWHDTALNWDSPAEPGPWDAAEHDRFDEAARQLLTELRLELGPSFEILDEIRPKSSG